MSCVQRRCPTLCPNGQRRRIKYLHEFESKGVAEPDGVVHPFPVDGGHFSAGVDDPQRPNSIGGPREVFNAPSNDRIASANPDLINALGTLVISDHGISQFFGPTGGSEHRSLLCTTTHPRSHPTRPMPRNPPSRPLHFSAPLPFPRHQSALHQASPFHTYPGLPARKLVRCYFEQLGWIFRGLTRGQVNDMLRAVYTAYGPQHTSCSPDGSTTDEAELIDERSDGEDEDYTGPHDLALLFMIFAAGALVQLPAPGCDEEDTHMQKAAAEAEHLYQIARAALALQPVLEKSSLVTIQTLHVLNIYTTLASSSAAHARDNGEKDGNTSMEMTWDVTLAAQLSQKIGLHRDGTRWGLSPRMVQRRRKLFWDLFTADMWNSLTTGRPPSFSLAYIDCSLPTYDDSEAIDGVYELWAFRFSAECVADVTTRTLAAKAPSYAIIIELDRKVKEFPLPLSDEAAGDFNPNLQRCMYTRDNRVFLSLRLLLLCYILTRSMNATVLLYLHQRFFALAILEQPTNPSESVYGPSYVAAYEASIKILKSAHAQFAVIPTRQWCSGVVVTQGPKTSLANAAMWELEMACVLFSKVAVYSRRATKALRILIEQSEKARLALTAAKNDASGGIASTLPVLELPVKVKKDEQRRTQQQEQHSHHQEQQYHAYNPELTQLYIASGDGHLEEAVNVPSTTLAFEDYSSSLTFDPHTPEKCNAGQSSWEGAHPVFEKSPRGVGALGSNGRELPLVVGPELEAQADQVREIIHSSR
ncbi:Zn(2)-C6 fungal-type domain-containing protein [Mycena sanguinolenta]|uniref:Zn(2)-C6 fungal-type domain-containing protein n=1 Tax=Mycena sanguinolenta TaxID=230812 RepID=A0A8H6ZAQ7_9AGAR|nr:Zn(2)-C6 fungal-type domain-containing protein [Mycena sanguinolenta]